MLIASRSTKNWRLWHILLLLLYTLLLSGPGGRYYALLPTLGAFVFYFLERKRSPKIWQVSLVILLIFYFIVGGLGFYRNPGIELGQTEFNVDTAWETFVGGSQLVLSTAASIYVVPRYSDYLYGYSFIQLLTQPIPRFLWPAKPSWFGPSELSSYWSYSAAAPFWVSFYLNFGYIGVIIGTMVLGWFSRKLFDSYRNDPQNIFAQVLLAVYIPFMIHGYGRGSNEPAFVIYGFLYVILPVLLLRGLTKWRFKSQFKPDYEGLNISIDSPKLLIDKPDK